MQIANLIDLLVKIAIMILLGYALRRKGFIDDAFKRKLGELLLVVVVPFGVLASGNSAFSPSVAAGLLQAGAIVAVYYIVTLLLMRLVAAPMPLSKPDKGLLGCLASFANVTFIGYPVSMALFGNEGVLYAVVYNLGWQFFLSLWGVRLIDPAGKTSWRTAARDPLLWASVGAVLLFISPFRVSPNIAEAFSELGAMSVPISMMIVGCSIADIPLRRIFTQPAAYVVSFLRLCALPLAMLLVLWALGLRGALPGTMVLLTGLPAGALNVVYAERYGANANFAAAAVVQSTVLMVATLPFLTMLMERVL